MGQLRVEQLARRFGGVIALAGVTFTVTGGERRAIIGPNGAGKSSLFNLITGELKPTQGRVYFEGQDITRLPVHRRARLGLSRTFQRNNLFPGLTVAENLSLAVQRLPRHRFKPGLRQAAIQQMIDDTLSRVGLIEQGDRPVRELAYGQQRVLEVALALATRPRLLLLDEPTAGMSPAETAEMSRLIEALPRSLTILIVEHDMDVVFSLADCITVLHQGQIISEGSPLEVRHDPQVQQIYLRSNDQLSLCNR